MNTLFNAYRNRTVLVTGHTGFKGSWLSLWLNELGSKVIGYSLEPPTNPSFFKTIGLEHKINHIIGDIRDNKKLLSVFKKYNPDFVFHLAAQPMVRFSYKEPRITYETNVMGTINVLEAIRQTNCVKVAVFVTSDKCYENMECPRCYNENDRLGGYDPYSSSKACCEIAINAYNKSFFSVDKTIRKHPVLISSVRAGNVIGGGDWGLDRLVPDCVKALYKNRIITIRNPGATRPWQYVLDALSGYLLLGSLMFNKGSKYTGAWNFGPKDSNILSVKDVVNQVIEFWGNGKYRTDTHTNPHEACMLKLNITKARRLLKWSPKYNVVQAIEKSVSWYKNFYARCGKEELMDLSVSEIKDYMFKM